MHYLSFLLLLFIFSCQSKKNNEDIFIKNGTAFIEVSSDELPEDSISFSVAFTSRLPDQYYKRKAFLRPGAIYLEIPCDRASTATISYGSKNHQVWISPNDTSSINISTTDHSISYSGKFSSINQYYLNKKDELNFQDRAQPINQIIQKAKEYSEILNNIDSIKHLEEVFLADQDLNEYFKSYEKNDILYGALNFKMTFPFFNDKANLIKKPLPDDYYNFLKNVNINQPEALRSTNYFGFLDYYFWGDINKDSLSNLNGKSRALFLRNHIYTKSKPELDNTIKKYYYSYQFSNLIKYYNDPVEIDSLAKAWQVEEQEYLSTHTGASLIHKNEKIEEGEKIPDFTFKDINGKSFQLSELKNKIIYINFWGTWCKPCLVNIPELNKMIESYSTNNNIAFLNICIKSKKEEWLKTVKKFNIKGKNLFISDEEKALRLASVFNVGGIPHYSIVGTDNILRVNYANKAPLVKKDLNSLLIENK